jgi:hypothetical protein
MLFGDMLRTASRGLQSSSQLGAAHPGTDRVAGRLSNLEPHRTLRLLL